jgi:hypothetical protein
MPSEQEEGPRQRDALMVGAPGARIPVRVVPTGETRQIAAETREVLNLVG